MFQNNKKMPFILAGAIVFSIIGNWEYIFQEKKQTPTVASASQAQVQQQVRPANNTQPAKKETKKETPAKKADTWQMTMLSQEDDWTVDPFGNSLEEEEKTEAIKPVIIKKKKKVTKLQLESILITQYKSLAIINNKLLSEGEELEGQKIVKITEDMVVMEEGGIETELKLKEYGIPVTYLKVNASSE